MRATAWIVSGVLRNRRRAAAIHLVVFLAALAGSFLLRQDNSPPVFFHQDAESLKTFDDMSRDFPGGSEILVMLEGDTLWTASGLAWVASLEDDIDTWPGVMSVTGPLTLHRRVLPYWPPEDITGLRSRVMEADAGLNVGRITSDGRMMLCTVEVLPGNEGLILPKLRERLASPPIRIRADVSGLPLLQEAMDQGLRGNALPFFFFLVLLSVVFLLAFFGNMRIAAVPLIQVFFCLVVTLGMMKAAGASLNLVNIVLAPLLLVISLSTSVHVLVHMLRISGKEDTVRGAIRKTYGSKGAPIIWTGLTTMAAFGSMVFSNSPPIRSLGLWTGAGIVIMTLSMFSLFPLILESARVSEVRMDLRKRLSRIGHLGELCARFAIQHRKIAFLSVALEGMVLVAGAMKLREEDHFTGYFAPDHPVRASIKKRQDSGLGVFAADLVLRYEDGNGFPGTGFHDPDVQSRLGLLTRSLRVLPGIRGAFGVNDLADAMVTAVLVDGAGTRNFRAMVMGMLRSLPEGRETVDRLVTEKGHATRIRLMLPLVDLHQTEALLTEVKNLAEDMFPRSVPQVTGAYPLLILAQVRLIHSLAISFSVTLACVLVVFLWIAGDFRFAMKLLIPNLWPIAALAGVMGWGGIPVDSASVLTFSVVLGLSVDDTLHTLGYLGRSGMGKEGIQIARVIERTAPAHLITSIFLVAGFTACAFSELGPVAAMGRLAATGILLAFLGDIFLVPALLGDSTQCPESVIGEGVPATGEPGKVV